MSLRSKLVAGFVGILTLVFTVSTLIINERLLSYTLEEQKTEARRATQQTAGATGIIFSEIETVLRQSYSDMNLAQTLSDSAGSEKVRERDLVSKLRYICYNSTYFEALLLLDEEGRSYVGAASLYETADSFCAGIQDEIEASRAAYTAWFQDEKGNVYVKKDVYSVTPLYRAGILIARLNSEKLLSLLGYSSVESARGVSAILYTDHLILSDKPMEPEVAQEIAARCIAGQGDGFVTVQDRTFWLTVCGNQPWYVIRLLEKDEMLRAPNFVRNLSLVTVVICAAFSTLLAWILCYSMTRNIQRLNQGMDRVGEGDFSIRVQVHGKDEVSQLTRKFNLFVEHLGNTTQQMVRQATAKKQMELEMMDLRYRSLQTQISPHFICNILASVKGLNSLGRKDEVNRLLVLTSRYLRKNLNNSDIRFVAVRDEVAVVEEYLQIYEQVYRQPIVLDLSLPQELRDCSVPSLLLLPLVENSIQHGGFDRKEAAVIKLRVHREEDRLILYLSDHGNGIPPQVLESIRDAVASPTRSLPGFGIRSVLMRLRLLYGEEQQFVITSHEGHTTITISLPYRIYDGASPESGTQ